MARLTGVIRIFQRDNDGGKAQGIAQVEQAPYYNTGKSYPQKQIYFTT
jgi:hypothetical protein